MRYACLLVFSCAWPIDVMSGAAMAAGNPVVDALMQGTVVQFSGKEAISQPFDFDVTIATSDKNLRE